MKFGASVGPRKPTASDQACGLRLHAFFSRSRPDRVRPVFDLVARGEVILCFSPDVLVEIRGVLTRPKLIAKFPTLTSEAVDAFLAHYLGAAQWFDRVPEHVILSRDPKDSKYLNLAITAGAPYLVTTDLDLLDLMTSQNTESLDFRRRFPGLLILDPVSFESVVKASEA